MFGNLGEMARLMQKVKDIQSNVKKMKEEAASAEYTANAQGGLVSVTVSGDMQIRNIRIAPEAMTSAEDLQAMVQSAVNNALDTAKKALAEQMKEVTGGMNIPGLF